MLTETEKKHLKQISIEQQRKALEIAQELRGISPNKVTYIISQEVEITNQDPKIRVITHIKELPEVRVYHDKTDVLGEFIQDVDIPTLVSSE
jgi:hypothetical protein